MFGKLLNQLGKWEIEINRNYLQIKFIETVSERVSFLFKRNKIRTAKPANRVIPKIKRASPLNIPPRIIPKIKAMKR